MVEDLQRLIEDLGDPQAWPWPVADVTSVQTHVSLVFLAGDRVLKLKKPVSLGFLDFSARAGRLAACRAEVRLDERFAPGVALGVVTVRADADGRRRVLDRPPSETDEADEPAVLMRRLPEERTLRSLLEGDRLDAATLARVAQRVAALQDAAVPGPEAKAAASFARVSALVLGNLAEARRAARPDVLQPELADRLLRELERELAARRALIEERDAAGCARDGHGDLRLDHVYVLDDEPPRDVVAIDGLEFDEGLRGGDPAGDAAFLVMELRHAGRGDLAGAFLRAWSDARGDAAAAALIPLFAAHRHVVRGKVRALGSVQPEMPEAQRRAAILAARTHFLGALTELSPPRGRPALVLMAGLPGSGKTTVARALASQAGFARVSSDETRHALATWISPAESWDGGLEGGLYSREWTDKTYRACREQAETLLLQGRRVVVDASFHERARRRELMALAGELRLPVLVLEATAPDDEANRRLRARTGDASDADVAVREAMRARWEPPDEHEADRWRIVATGAAPSVSIARALAVLRAESLMS